MLKRARRHHTAEQKATVLKRHSIDKVPFRTSATRRGFNRTSPTSAAPALQERRSGGLSPSFATSTAPETTVSPGAARQLPRHH